MGKRAAIFFALAIAGPIPTGACRQLLARWWAEQARASPHWRSVYCMAQLRRLGARGWEELLGLAQDRTPLPFARGPYSALIMPDSVADLALDELRHLRYGRPTPRAFAWSVLDGTSYEEALERFRQAELAEAISWWSEQKRRRRCGGLPDQDRMLSP